jgi:hypothetical protein
MLKFCFSLSAPLFRLARKNSNAFNFPRFALFFALVVLPFVVYGQGSMQRLVRISGDNGNIISLSAGAPAATYTLTLPPNINPSTSAASILFGTGSGLLDWTPAAGSDSGFVIQLIDVGGGQLKPRWVDPSTFEGPYEYWSLDGNAPTASWNGTTGSFLGTTSSTPLILATTNTTTPQPIEFYTNNAERMRLAPTGELGIGVTPASGVLLHVGGTAGTSNVRFNSLSGANLPLVFGVNEGLLIADANGNLTKRDPSMLQQNYVQYDIGSQQGQSATRSNFLFNVGYSATANDANAVGALIASTGGATNRNATALTLGATATGVGTATGLNVTASGGASNNAIDATGNIRLLSSGGFASRLSLQNPAGTFATTLSAGAQTANINYTLPTTPPPANGYVLAATTAGVMTWTDPTAVGGASNVLYDVTTPQTQSTTRTDYLYNVAYSGAANDANAAGAVITSAAGATNRNATGLTVTSTASGTGTSTGLSVTASGGTTNNAINAVGNVNLFANGATPSSLLLYGPNGSFYSAFTAGTQTANLMYTLPTAAPTNGQVLSSTSAGVLSWATPSSGLSGSGTATRIAFWGPGPGVTTNLMDDANLYWDNTNYRLSVGSGASPVTPLHVTLNDAGTATVANVATLDHTSTGTPAAGFGEALNFRLQTGTGGAAQTRDAAKIGTLWETASDANRTGALTFTTVDSGAATEKVRITGEGYIGIGNTDPNYSVDMTGAYGTRATTITCSSATQNDNVYIGNSSYIRIVGPTGPFTMSGMGQGFDGKRVRVANLTGQDWTILDSSSSSSAGNRFVTGTNSDVTIKGPVSVLDFIYDGPTGQWFLGTLNANQIIGSVGSLTYRYKTADETVTNSAVIQDDDHLWFYVNAGETWEINGEMDASNPANNYDIKCAFEIPTSAAMKIMYTGIQDAGGNAVQGNGQFTASNGTKTVQINGGVHTLITFRGIIRAISNSGYVKFRWAQGTANLVNPTTLHQYSYLKITRIQ